MIIGYADYLPGDSLDYDVLFRAVEKSKPIPGLACEIGVRRGGSLQYIIDALSGSNKHIIAIDPYGNIEYNATEEQRNIRLDYTNDMKHEAMSNIYNYSRGKGVNLIFINLDDVEFMTRYEQGVPVYNQTKQIINDYSFVFFDGPHDVVSILVEVKYFTQRSKVGTVFVFDDIETYPHHLVEQELFATGFVLLENGPQKRKASYFRKELNK